MGSDKAKTATPWSEADSALFIDEGAYFVPERELQIAAICALVPHDVGPKPGGKRGHVVELCCGEGLLTRALLAAFPDIRVQAYDGSPRMLEATRATAGFNADRLTTQRFDLEAEDWRHFDWPLTAVVSSLAIHHLDAAGKQKLYTDMAAALAPGGVLVVADLVAPASPRAHALAAAGWDEAVRRRALELDGNLAAFERFQETGWNFFADPDPDPIDKPSPLYDQLRWLDAAGLTGVDVVWMKAGHAIFCGYKPGA
ncbi:MAG: class I SAM-dependent methyltransferase [Kiloniellales bacterium]